MWVDLPFLTTICKPLFNATSFQLLCIKCQEISSWHLKVSGISFLVTLFKMPQPDMLMRCEDIVIKILRDAKTKILDTSWHPIVWVLLLETVTLLTCMIKWKYNVHVKVYFCSWELDGIKRPIFSLLLHQLPCNL